MADNRVGAASAFEYQPTLTGALVTLRPLRPDDHDSLYAAAADPLIWVQHPVPDRYRPEVFRKFFEEGIATGRALIVSDNSSGRVIGSSRFGVCDHRASEVEIGWTFLARAWWGGSYNGEMKRLMCAHAFRFVERVVLLVAPANIRSRRAVERLGAAEVGKRLDGSGQIAIEYELRRVADRDRLSGSQELTAIRFRGEH